MKQRNWKGALISVLIVEILGLLSGLLSGNTGQAYQSYVKPALSPPGWLFGVAWVILYALMGLAAYLIFSEQVQQKIKGSGLKLFAVQLAVNLLWPVVFFRFDLLWPAVVLIVLLDVLVVFTICSFWKVNRTAALLMLPYLLWILFATYLNIGFAVLN